MHNHVQHVRIDLYSYLVGVWGFIIALKKNRANFAPFLGAIRSLYTRQAACCVRKLEQNDCCERPGAASTANGFVFFWAEWSHRNARAFFSFCPNLKFQRHGLNSKWDLTTNPNRQKAKTIQMLIFPLRMGLSRQKSSSSTYNGQYLCKVRTKFDEN